jgi:DNA-binding CsgD family transcriptional regulator
VAFSQKRYKDAFSHFSIADDEGVLRPEELAQFGDAAYLVGREDVAVAAWGRAHHAFVADGACRRAARLGFRLSLSLLLEGHRAQSRGWLARTQRLLRDHRQACAEHGLTVLLDGLFAMRKGDADTAHARFEEATRCAERFSDSDLLALGILGRGQALLQLGRANEGIALLDEAMVAVTEGEVSTILAGIIYCAVIRTCERAYDLHRAHEWTEALDRWCSEQPQLVAFRGECLVLRSVVLQLHGDWADALEEARRASDALGEGSERTLGRALYQQAEVHRLLGELARADELYREAGDRGFEPEPGASLLRLAQGDLEAAVSSIRRVEAEAGKQQGLGARSQRVTVLGPFVEIMLAAEELESARAAAEELAAVALRSDAPFLEATAAHQTGAVDLASGKPQVSLASLRQAWMLWQQLQAPYESARARVLIGRACECVGDRDSAEIHLNAAASVFERLGAVVDLARVRGLSDERVPIADEARALSRRERQVLVQVASGKTNRQVATALGISEHTVARHISNIFHKIGVSTRTAASAFAYEHHLI